MQVGFFLNLTKVPFPFEVSIMPTIVIWVLHWLIGIIHIGYSNVASHDGNYDCVSCRIVPCHVVLKIDCMPARF